MFSSFYFVNYCYRVKYGFEPQNLTANVEILPTIYANDVFKVFRNGTQYYATFLDGQGNPLAEGTNVTFNINGVFYTRQVNGSEGKAKLNINLSPGKYIITGEYNDCRVSNTVEVIPVLTATDFVKSTSETKAFEAKLIDGQGNPLSKETVTFNINGVLYNRITDINGIAKLNINLQKGEYIITSSYNGQNIANTITVTE